jgi:gliding motility-associated lipoprotein GldH
MNALGWHADSIANFKVEVTDTISDYAVYIKLRHNHNYPFRNIWFFRTITSERGVEYADTINYVLADDMGKWLGKGIGDKKLVTMPLRTQALRFNKTGEYQFGIQHGMRDTVLSGILEIGLEVFSRNIAESNGKEEN